MKTKGNEVEKKGLRNCPWRILTLYEGEGSRKFRTFLECLGKSKRIFNAYGRVRKAWNLKEIPPVLGPPLEWAQLSGLYFNTCATIIPIFWHSPILSHFMVPTSCTWLGALMKSVSLFLLFQERSRSEIFNGSSIASFKALCWKLWAVELGWFTWIQTSKLVFAKPVCEISHNADKILQCLFFQDEDKYLLWKSTNFLAPIFMSYKDIMHKEGTLDNVNSYSTINSIRHPSPHT